MLSVNKIEMKRFLTLFLFFGLILAGAHAQIMEPVQWTSKSEKVAEGEYDLIFSATVEDEWHLYSIDLPAGGPMPTEFSYESMDGFELVGKIIVSPEAEDGYDADFQMDVKYHSYGAEFTQRVKLTTKGTLSRGTSSSGLEYLVCSAFSSSRFSMFSSEVKTR